ncbi:unnamed protein product [Lupinus luteus]|uniref:Uncharacterized protein n=1 Tax=Lupinus luteus TaxID=3873 RepID=A0AAV1XQG3_LUPLU
MNQRQGEKKQLQKTEACDLRAGVGAEHSLVNVSGDNNMTSNNRGSDPIHDYYDQNHYHLNHHQLGLIHFGNVNKKKRMVRQRRSSTNTTFMYQLNPFSSKLSPPVTPPPPPPPPFLLPPTTSLVPLPPSPARETHHGKLKFLFQKELKNSDVSSLRRMVLPKVIQAKKASDHDEFMEETSDTTNDIFLNDSEVNKPDSFNITHPSVNETGMSFIYDTTFSNDSPFDFLGGSMTSLSRTGTDETFGSVENLSLDDFY